MSRVSQVLSFAVGLTLLCAGCPLGPGSALVPTAGSGSSGTSAAVAGGGAQDFDDQLSEQFPTCVEPIEGDAWRDEILRLVNVERAHAGLSALARNRTLEDQATQYACEMIHYDFFDHENPATGSELRDRAEEFGYDYVMIGENLAVGHSTPAHVMRDWMNSPDHRDNILNPEFTELGVGVRTGGHFGTYWVQEFGRPWPP